MLTLSNRALREVAYDAQARSFLGRVEITFTEDAEDAPHVARILASLALPPRSRFAQVEAALLDEAERLLRLRLAALGQGPANIFADPPRPAPAAARRAA